MAAVKLVKESTRFLMATRDREGDKGPFILRAPYGIYASERDAIYAWSNESRYKKEKDMLLIGDADKQMFRSLLWGEVKSFWKLLNGKVPMPTNLDVILTSLAETLRTLEPDSVERKGPRRLSRTAGESISDPTPIGEYQGKAHKRSGGVGKGGSALIKALADEKGITASKVRALLRKAGLSAPYTDSEECRKALGL